MLLRAEGLTLALGRGSCQRVLFQDLDFSLGQGDVVGLVGPSGAGKTSLGDVLLGLRKPSAGRVWWEGVEVYGQDRSARRRLRPCFQKLYQDPVTSFCPWQLLGQAFHDLVGQHGLAADGPKAAELIEAALAEVMLPPELLARRPDQVSGGELQRLALARIRLLRPRLVVADEPTSRLDLSVQARIIRLLLGMARGEGAAVLLIGHDRDLVRAVCARTLEISPALNLGWRMAV